MGNIKWLNDGKGYENFYLQCDEFKLPLIEKISQLHCYVDDCCLSDLPWERLVRRGLATINHVYCETCVEALLWGNEIDVLKEVLPVLKEDMLKQGY